MRIILLCLFLSGCEPIPKENKVTDGKSVVVCHKEVWRSECGPTYIACDDGQEHGCGKDLWMVQE
jgi:hypothetical protein